MTETPDKLCLRAEATGKLTFVTLANSVRNTCCQLENARIGWLGCNDSCQFVKAQTIV